MLLHPPVSSQELFNAIASKDIPAETKLDLILQLKTHVKKDLVDMKQVPQYFDALAIAADIHDSGILSNSFTVICHLVKRVSMQDKSGKMLELQSYLVLPILINRMGDLKSSTISSSKKALEAYWFSAPKAVETALGDLAFKSRNSNINLEAVHWLHDIILNVNQHFTLNIFLPHLVNLLNNNDHKLILAVKDLLTDYYNLKQNRLYKQDLLRELELQNVPHSISSSVMSSITGGLRLIKEPLKDHSKLDSKLDPKVETKLALLNLLQLKEPLKEVLKEPLQLDLQSETSHSSLPESLQHKPVYAPASHSDPVDPELQKILTRVKYDLDPSIRPLNFRSADQLTTAVNELLPPFGNKETEFNWGTREKNIIKLRSIVRGNSPADFTESIINSIRDAAEGICKSVSSLRTTLSSHGCQLVKEFAIVLGTNFDILLDYFMPHLIKLCSATKLIAHTNANMAICAIFVNCAFNSRILTKITNAAQDKNVLPRNYSGIWMQIIILRFHNNPNFLTPHGSVPSGIEVCCKVLPKLFADPNPAVRQVAKESFWCFWGKFPTDAEALLTTLEAKVAKGVERSKPLGSKAAITALPPKKPRLSLKETILERNKELRKTKEAAAAANSRPQSRIETDKRVNRDDSKRGTRDDIDKRVKPVAPIIGERINKLGHPIRSLPNAPTNLLKSIERHLNRPVSVELVSVSEKREKSPVTPAIAEEDVVEQAPGAQDKHIQNTPVVEKEFDIQTDPILKFLSSNQAELITEGINLLKYAIFNQEKLSSELQGLLRKISIRDPELLSPLFLSTDNLFKKTYQFFSAEDFFRVCAVLINPVDEHKCNLIISVVDVNQIYDSINKLLSYTISTSNILDNDDELTIQMIRYKSTIIQMIVDFLNKGLDKIPISDSYFLKLTSNLFDLMSLVRSTIVYDSFGELLRKLNSINAGLFVGELDLQDESTREEVEEVVVIDSRTKKEATRTHFEPFFDLTKVVPSNNVVEFSPIKLGTDFTMIPLKVNDQSVKHIDIDMEPDFENVDENVDFEDDVYDSMEVDAQNDDKAIADINAENIQTSILKIPVPDLNSDSLELSSPSLEPENQKPDHDSRLNKEKARPSFGEVSEKDNVFVDLNKRSNNTKSEMFSNFNHPNEMNDDFALVKSSEPNGYRVDPIQSLIDKVDPLRSVLSKNKPIAIYEDGTGSPQKVKEYNYSEMNWFNYQLAKLSIDKDSAVAGQDVSIGLYKAICHEIQSNSVSGPNFIILLNYLQNLDLCDLEFHDYFERQGKDLLANSLWMFFDNSTSSSQTSMLSGVILIKQLLVNRCKLDFTKLWNALVTLSNTIQKSSSSEFNYALSETFDETLTGVYGTQQILSHILLSLEESKYLNSSSLIFILDSLSKVLGMGSLELVIDDSLILKVDRILHNLINSEVVEVRRSVIQTYSKLLSASKVSHAMDVSSLNEPIEKNGMNDIMERFTVTQKKLIEYYSLC